MIYDLEDRTRKLSKTTIELLRTVRIDEINRNIINQLIRAITSVDANYCEANAGSSRKDFRNKIYICRKEVQETKYWIEMLAATNPGIKEQLRILWREAQELTLIFNKISSTLNRKDGDIEN